MLYQDPHNLFIIFSLLPKQKPRVEDAFSRPEVEYVLVGRHRHSWIGLDRSILPKLREASSQSKFNESKSQSSKSLLPNASPETKLPRGLRFRFRDLSTGRVEIVGDEKWVVFLWSVSIHRNCEVLPGPIWLDPWR